MKRRTMLVLGTLGVGLLTTQQAGGQQAPQFQADSSWPQLPNNWVLGNVTSVAVGPDDHVWVLHRPRMVPEPLKARAAPPVVEFDETGKFKNAWGGDGQGYDWPGTEHAVTVDAKGNVWFTGSSPSGGSLTRLADNMILKFSSAGKFLLQIGGRGLPGGNKDTKNLERAADLDVYEKTNEVFVADGYGNRRVIVFDASTGAFKRMWGAFGNPPDNDPPAPLPGPPSGRGGGGRGRGAASEPPTDTEGPSSPRFGNPVHSIEVSNDGLVYVADRSNRRIQVFTLDGKYVTQVFINRNGPTLSTCGIALSRDPQQTYMYVADYGNSAVVVVERKTLKVLSQFGKSGAAPGEFQGLHFLAADLKGNIYTAEVGPGNRAQRFLLRKK